MAPPAYGNRGTYLVGDDVNTANVPRPTGTALGDLVLVCLYIEADDNPSTVPAGFTQLPSPPQIPEGEDGGHTLRVYWKRATASEPTTYNFAGWTAPWRSAVAIRVTGADTTNPVDVVDTGVTTSPDPDGPILSVTTTGPDLLLVSIRANFWGGNWAPISGFTERVDDGDAIGIGTRTFTTQGSSGNVQGVVTSPDPDQDYQSAWLIALKPIVTSQTITSPVPIPTPPAPYEPEIDQTPTITFPPIEAPDPPFEPAVIPGPVDIDLGDPIPAPPAPFEPKLVQVIRMGDPIPPPPPPFDPEIEGEIRPPLRVDFWALDDDGSVLCPLPHVTSWDLSLVPGENGAVQLEYPRDGLHYDVLNSRITKKRDLRIRIRTDGTHARSMGALLHARDGDEVAEGGTTRFIGAFLPILLGEAPLPFNEASDDGSWTFTDGTAGSILIDALNTVQADGYLQDTEWSFTDQFDSNGVEWSLETSAVFSPGKSILELVQQLRAWGMCEFEVVDSPSGGLEVRAYEPSTVGTDFTLSDPPIVFRAGRDLAEAPHKADVSDAATSLLIAGDEGVYVEVDDPSAIAARGRKVGRFISEGNLTTEGAALAYGELELSRSVEGVDELTHALTFSQDQPVPIRELMPMDWVYSDTGTGLIRNRIAQVTISQASGDDTYSGGITLGDLIAGRDVIVQRQLDGLIGGQIVTGTSTQGPETDDGKSPAQVQGVAVTSGAYPQQDQTLAAVTATWLAVTDNSDGSPASNIQQYEIQYRYAGGEEGLPTDWIAVAPQTDLDASWDSVIAGVLIAVRVRAVNRFGRAGEWSAEENHVTDADSTPPPVPSALVATNWSGIVRLDWDGLGSAGEAMPDDFLQGELLASQTNDFSEDDDPILVGTLRGHGTDPWVPPADGGGEGTEYGVTWYFKARTRDRSGNVSALGAQATAAPAELEEGDIASVNIGALKTGILDAIMAVIGIIRAGDANGSRVELDNTGLYCINAAGETVFSYVIDQELLQIIGRVIAGAGIGNGPTVVIDPDQPAIDLYPNATERRFQTRAWTGNLAGGGTGPVLDIQAVNASDAARGPFVHMEAASDSTGLTWIGHRTSGSGVSTQGGVLKLQQNGIAILGNDDDSIQIDGDGVNIFGGTGLQGRLNVRTISYYDGTSAQYATNNGPAIFFDWIGGTNPLVIRRADTLGSAKQFIIDHPVDPDRWLIHACAEGPVAELLYSGEAVIWDGRAEVELPSYFEAASRKDGRQVQLTPVDELCMVAASEIENGKFTIKCSGPDGTVVSWRAIAVRADVEQFPVEPLKSEVNVRGDGPYRYLAPKFDVNSEMEKQ